MDGMLVAGTLVGSGVCVAVGTGVTVGGTDVSVGNIAVAVGRSGVAVSGSKVAVAVGSAFPQPASRARMNTRMTITS